MNARPGKTPKALEGCKARKRISVALRDFGTGDPPRGFWLRGGRRSRGRGEEVHVPR